MQIFYLLQSRRLFQLTLTIIIILAALKLFIFDRRRKAFDTTSDLKMLASKFRSQSSFDVLDILPNCGIPYTCPDDTFPVHIHTGRPKLDQAKFCIQGKYVTNYADNGGRGLNIAVVDSERLELKEFVTFDVYLESSVALDSWINKTINEKDIILIYTYDEASRMLRESSRKIFYDFGSSKIQDLHFRSQWYMVSQKKIGGFTPFEKVTMAKTGDWGDAIDERFCIP